MTGTRVLVALRVVDAVVSIVSRLVLGAWARLPLRLRPERRTARSRGMYAHGGNAKNPAGVASEIRLVTFGDFLGVFRKHTHTQTHTARVKKTSLSLTLFTNKLCPITRAEGFCDRQPGCQVCRSFKQTLSCYPVSEARARGGGGGEDRQSKAVS